MKEFISLADANPEVASWWHPTKNGNMTPKGVAPRSHKRVWWLYPYDDPNTGKHFDFEWQATVDHTTDSGRCPFFSNQVIWVGFNDLQTVNPELAREWHPTRNGDLTPLKVAATSCKKVWWQISHFDESTGKTFVFEWQSEVYRRNDGVQCPYLTNHAVWPGFNDLATKCPHLIQEWHPTKNGNLTPSDFAMKSNKKVWWAINHFDKNTGKTFFFEWEAVISDRAGGDGCPYLSGHRLYTGFNDLATINPKLVKEWDYNKNKKTPSDYPAMSHEQVWWKCDLGHSWKARIDRRHGQNAGCPHCKKSLRTSQPELITYYYVKKHFPDALSGDRKTFGFELDIYIPSIKTAIEYDGVAWHNDKHEKDSIKNDKCFENGIRLIRIREDGCPNIDTSKHVTVYQVKPRNNDSLKSAILQIGSDLNVLFDVDIERDSTEILSIIDYAKKKGSLAELYPEVAKDWHPTKNGNLRPESIKSGSDKRVWWQIVHEENGQEFIFEWQSSVSDRTRGHRGCPYLSGQKVYTGFNDLATKHPQIALEWDYTKNDSQMSPSTITSCSNKKVWWKCKEGHSWMAHPNNRSRGRGCPHCYALSRKSKSK